MPFASPTFALSYNCPVSRVMFFIIMIIIRFVTLCSLHKWPLSFIHPNKTISHIVPNAMSFIHANINMSHIVPCAISFTHPNITFSLCPSVSALPDETTHCIPHFFCHIPCIIELRFIRLRVCLWPFSSCARPCINVHMVYLSDHCI